MDLSKIVKGIRIESAFLPTIDIPDPFQPGPPNPFLQALKPKITVDLGDLSRPVVVSPYGEPGESMWPAIKMGLVVLGLGFLAWRVLR